MEEAKEISKELINKQEETQIKTKPNNIGQKEESHICF